MTAFGKYTQFPDRIPYISLADTFLFPLSQRHQWYLRLKRRDESYWRPFQPPRIYLDVRPGKCQTHRTYQRNLFHSAACQRNQYSHSSRSHPCWICHRLVPTTSPHFAAPHSKDHHQQHEAYLFHSCIICAAWCPSAAVLIPYYI